MSRETRNIYEITNKSKKARNDFDEANSSDDSSILDTSNNSKSSKSFSESSKETNTSSSSSSSSSSKSSSASKSSKKYSNNNLSKSDESSNNDSDNDDSDENQPDGAECLSRCKEFASITGTDTALAMFYLQDNKWDLEKGLNMYFQSTQSTGSKVVACFDVEKLNEDERKRKSSSLNESSSDDDLVYLATTSKSEAKETTKLVKDDDNDDEQKGHFKTMSWNIDGLDKTSLESRTQGVIQTILREKPDVILLQEVVDTSEKILKDSLSLIYEFVTGNSFVNKIDYFTMIAIKRNTCKLTSKIIINFEQTLMGRNIIQVKLIYKNSVNICAMTSHLESTAEYAKSRIEQLKKCLSLMQQVDSNFVVVFGGDLNLRDSELSAIGGLPKDIHDCWESTGKRKECLYTWDTSRNTNLKMNGKFKPKLRFDRMYFRPSKLLSDESTSKEKLLTLMPVYFELEGLERLKNCSRFCSDHWAIQSYFQVEEVK